MLRRLLVASLALALAGCGTREAKRTEGEVGLFYGDQVQERPEIVVGKSTPQTFGFRVVFPLRLETDRTVLALVTRPGPLGRRVTEHLRLVAKKGEDSLSYALVVPPRSSGIWNVRATVDGELVLDRAFRVRNEGE